MVNSNMPMEMSPEWKAITKCESKIEALEKTLERHGENKRLKIYLNPCTE